MFGKEQGSQKLENVVFRSALYLLETYDTLLSNMNNFK
jgi:hypothetical protein